MGKRTRKRKVAALAAVNYEPVSADTLEELRSISDQDWLSHLANIRLAFIGLSKTKEELKEVARAALADDEFNPIEGFKQSIEFLSAGVEFLTIIKWRILYAAAEITLEAEAATEEAHT